MLSIVILSIFLSYFDNMRVLVLSATTLNVVMMNIIMLGIIRLRVVVLLW
jgi:hypothetical protein